MSGRAPLRALLARPAHWLAQVRERQNTGPASSVPALAVVVMVDRAPRPRHVKQAPHLQL